MFTFSPSSEVEKVNKSVNSVNKPRPLVPSPGRTFPAESDLIDELRIRLHRCRGALFKAEAQLAIVTGERDRLAEKLRITI